MYFLHCHVYGVQAALTHPDQLALPLLFCCLQGTLRDQLDRQLLPHLPGSSFVHPAVAVALGHDIAAAMLHLHREGIV